MKVNSAAFLFLLIIALAALLAPWLAPYSYETQNLDKILIGPTGDHWFGTDYLGRDLLSRILYGARVSLFVGIGTGLAAFLFGLVLGGAAGYFGGAVDLALSFIFDLLQSVPLLVLAILFGVVWQQHKLFSDPHAQSICEVVLTLSSVGWVGAARIVRSQVQELIARPFVEAAKALGAGPTRLMLRHIFPFVWSHLFLFLILQTPTNILLESFLSFLGLGLQPPFSSWGVLMAEGWRTLRSHPHLFFAPAGVLFLTMLAFNRVGDAVQIYFDPKLRDKLL